MANNVKLKEDIVKLRIIFPFSAKEHTEIKKFFICFLLKQKT